MQLLCYYLHMKYVCVCFRTEVKNSLAFPGVIAHMVVRSKMLKWWNIWRVYRFTSSYPPAAVVKFLWVLENTSYTVYTTLFLIVPYSLSLSLSQLFLRSQRNPSSPPQSGWEEAPATAPRTEEQSAHCKRRNGTGVTYPGILNTKSDKYWYLPPKH